MARNHHCLLGFFYSLISGVGEGSMWYLCQVPTQLQTQCAFCWEADLERWVVLTRGSDVTSSRVQAVSGIQSLAVEGD